MKLIIPLVLALLSVLSACSNTEIMGEVVVDTSSPLLIEDLITENSESDFSAIIDSLILVPLQETENSFIGPINRMRRANNKFYILSDDKFYLFDGNGKFIKTIAVRGQGPEEVLEFNDFDVDGNNLVILDHTKLMWYDVNGNFIKSTPNNYGFGRIRLADKESILMTAVVPLENGNHIIMLDNAGDTVFSVYKSYPYPIVRIFDLFKLNDTTFIHPLFASGGNEIFLVNTSEKNGRFVPTAMFDNPMSADGYFEHRKNGKPINVPDLTFVSWTDNNESLLIPAFKQGKVYAYIYDKPTGKTVKISASDLTDDIFGEDKGVESIFSAQKITSDDDFFVFIIENPQEVFERSGRLNPRFKSEYEKLEGLTDESNPALALIKFRKSD